MLVIYINVFVSTYTPIIYYTLQVCDPLVTSLQQLVGWFVVMAQISEAILSRRPRIISWLLTTTHIF